VSPRRNVINLTWLSTGGLAGFLIWLGLAAIVFGVVAVLSGRLARAALSGRRTAGAVVGSGLVALIVGAALAPGATPPLTTAPSADVAAASVTPTPAPSRIPKRGTALAVGAALAVKGRAPRTGYDRADYGPTWTDDTPVADGHNGCDTRNDILRRDLDPVTVRAGTNGCLVVSGTLTDPYTGRRIGFVRGVTTSTAIQIDHVVALGDSWQKGAQSWTRETRIAFANDPLNLLAVKGSANESKGDGDTATWLPPDKSIRCTYVARQISVKAKYRLWTTSAEQAAMERVLTACPDQPIVTAEQSIRRTSSSAHVATSPTPTPTPTTSARPSRKPTRTPTSPTPRAPARSFDNCTDMHTVYPHGVGLPDAHDHTSGNPVTDFVRSTALYDANSGSDRDGDFVACESH
jgi:hypothetical protein